MGLRICHLGCTDYRQTWEAMRRFTLARTPRTPDELWLTEHAPVFTLGQAGKAEHIRRDIGIPVIKSDRGGQVTYHGPGQLIVYLLLDLRRRHLKAGEMVRRIETAIVDFLADEGLTANRRTGAPGVYMGAAGEGAKIAALGLRISNGASYHGLSLNVAMDLTPFSAIDPCGYPGLAVTQMRDEGVSLTLEEAGEKLCPHLLAQFREADP